MNNHRLKIALFGALAIGGFLGWGSLPEPRPAVQFPVAIQQAADKPAAAAGGEADDAELEGKAHRVMQQYCTDCHGEKQQKGKVRLDALETIDSVDRQGLFANAREAVHFGDMPPKKAKQPTKAERELLLKWLGQQLTGDAAQKLAEKLRRPESGNYVDHDELFSGKHAGKPGFTYDRRWLISEFIFNEKFNRILEHNPHRTIDGKRQYVKGDSHRRGINLTNPFLLPTHAGVRYYANETLNGGHLLTMLTNAKDAADHMMYLVRRNSRYLPAAREIMSLKDRHNATLASREKFMGQHIERVLKDVFGKKHEALLPKFVRVQVPPPIANDGKTKKAGFASANPGRYELVIIYHSMVRNHVDGQSDAELIKKCEREWFYHGHNERKIKARITFLNNYMDEWRKQIKQHRYAERQRLYPYKPLADSEMRAIEQAVMKHRKAGDRFNTIVARCMEQWRSEFEQERAQAGPPEDKLLVELIKQLFVKVHEREPSSREVEKYLGLAKSYIQNLGREKAIEKLMQTLILNTEFVYRSEFGKGEADAHGRRKLSPRDAAYALAYALTDSGPDDELLKAAQDGRLSTRADYEREVKRMLARRDQVTIVDERLGRGNDIDSFTNMPIRELRFFREFFGYPKLLSIFKDRKRFGGDYDKAKVRLVIEADRLVEHILENDRDVIKTLLTTDQFYVYHSGNNEEMKKASDRIGRIYAYFKDKDWRNFTVDDLAKHKDFIGEVKMRGIDVKRLKKDRRYNPLRAFQTQMESFELRLGKGQKAAAPYPSFPAHGPSNAETRFGGRMTPVDVAKFFNVDLNNWDYPTTQPTKMPYRKGMLTHPAWLIAFAQNTETDPIHRGKWIQEKLLAGTIPDVPITVDAVIPEDPHKTLRQRMVAKTGNDYCWTCHQKMEPLGLPFEMYDDFGRYRTKERLEYPENLVKKVKDKGGPEEDLRDIYKTLPVVKTGTLKGTGNKKLDGEVTDALDLIGRLAKSERVRQSIIRHAFRYFLGRNEMLSDSKTLIDADKAYVESGGSWDAVIVSLLTSDSFMYRKAPPKQQTAEAKD